ncbi:MAG TPA: FUSC family protein, partial [Candidatus Binatia bacterium]|nr:FUSC family protein [Candidatus Binatia bacterium]
AVYRDVAELLFATGTSRAVEARQALTAAFDAAYDLLLGARARASGRDPETRRLASLLNAATGLVEPSVAIAHARSRPPAALGWAASSLADAIERDRPPPALPPEDREDDPLLAELRSGLSSARSRFTRIPPGELSTQRGSLWARALEAAEHLLVGPEGWLFAARLALCMSLAGIARELVPLGRGYWVLLTTALVLKPDFGSVFARAIQRAAGTLVGVLIAAVLLGLLAPGPLLLACVPVFAALLPYAVRRNYGLFAAFLTPIAILLLDFGFPVDASIVGVRLLDTLLGCAIVLIAGYLLWPETWRVRLGGRVADAADLIADYLEAAFGASAARRRQLRRRTYSDLADLRVAMQRTLAEPPPMRTRAMAWWPVILQLERAADAITEASIRARGGEPAPDPREVEQLAAALRDLLDALRDQRSPSRLPVPGNGVLAGVADEVRTARRLASRRAGDGPGGLEQGARDRNEATGAG